MGKLEDEINKLKQAGKEMSDSLRKTIEQKDKSAQSSDNLTTSEKKLTTQTEQFVQSNKKVVKTIQDNVRARTEELAVIADIISKVQLEDGSLNQLTVATIKGKDARRSNVLELKNESKQRKESNKLLKEAIINRHKETIADEKAAEAKRRAAQKEKELIESIKGRDARADSKIQFDNEVAGRARVNKALKENILARHKEAQVIEKRKERIDNLILQARLEGKVIKGNTRLLKLRQKAVQNGGKWETIFRHELRNTRIEVDRTSKSLYGQILAHTGLDQAVKRAVRNQRNLGGTFSVLRSKILLASFGISLFSRGIVSLVRMYGEQEKAERKIHQSISTTGRRAHIASQEIINYASELQNLVAVGDEVILESSAMLTSFTRVDKVFKEAQLAVLNLSAGMNQDLKTSTIQLGKALQNPLAGINSLARVGVKLSGEQKKQIRDNLHLNDIYGAQKVIIDELNREFGGMAEAIASMTTGELDKLSAAAGDLGERVGSVLAPSILAMTEMSRDFVESLDTDKVNIFATAIISLSTAVGSLALLKWAAQKILVYRASIMAATKATLIFKTALFGIVGAIGLVIFNSMRQRIELNKQKEATLDLTDSNKDLAQSLKAIAAARGFDAADKELRKLEKQLKNAEDAIKPFTQIDQALANSVGQTIVSNTDMVKNFEMSMMNSSVSINDRLNKIGMGGTQNRMPVIANLIAGIEAIDKGMGAVELSTSEYLGKVNAMVASGATLKEAFETVTGRDFNLSEGIDKSKEATDEQIAEVARLKAQYSEVKAEYEKFAAKLKEGFSLEVVDKMIKLDETMEKLRSKDNVGYVTESFKEINAQGEGLRSVREKIFGIGEQFTFVRDAIDGGKQELIKFADDDSFEKQKIQIQANQLALKTYGLELETIRNQNSKQAEHLENYVREREEINKNKAAIEDFQKVSISNNRLQIQLDIARVKSSRDAVLKMIQGLKDEDMLKRKINKEYNLEMMAMYAAEASHYLGHMSNAVNMVSDVLSQGIESRRAKLDAEVEALAAAHDLEKQSAMYSMASTRMKMKIDKKHQKEKDALAKKQEAARRKLFKQEKKLQIAQAMMNMAQGIANALTIKPAWLGIAMSVVNAATGLASVKMIQEQQYARYGGIVGGRRHSEGGTSVMAERGEYVMRREAVADIGVSNMNALNSGVIPSDISNKVSSSSSQSVNVSFAGNVMSDEFLEDEAIPKIKEMLRRGSDLG